ncbi:uncharacterized protein LOC123315835 isoform X2 [Coccinella septempunctata]|uniref:uncharacterized protein LOC123315835 isoform X2 n=1 Tax=Coccinella septempunctata TaxID=41139 RepID=UPI001D063CA0|nr:uncharacterized protein LOC123315835 isoform X2 [Coccinella septempunctata]
MNDDDYDFESTEKLSALFKKDYEAGNSSLIYQAPKQPSSSSTSVPGTNYKTFHKYIQLYESHDGKLCGKYVIALVNSNANPTEMLIYQSKKKIFIRRPICEKQLFKYTNNRTLILNEREQQFRLEFENETEYLEFTSEYAKYGGLIEVLKDSENYNRNQTVSLDFTLETGCTKSPRAVVDCINDKNDRSNILTRLEKIGISQLPPFEIVKDNMRNVVSSKGDEKPNGNCTSNEVGKKTYIKELSNSLNTLNDVQRNKSELGTREHTVLKPESTITSEKIELLTSVLINNQTNNSELKEAIHLLTSKLKEIVPLKECDNKNEFKKLESKIKSLELKSENLQCELDKFHKKYANHKDSQSKELSLKQDENMCDVACQTDYFEYISKETNHLMSILPQILSVVESLSLTADDIIELKKIKDGIHDPQLKTIVEPYFNFTEEKNRSEMKADNEVSRNEFLTALKKIMNNMYQNICTSDPNTDFKNLLAKQIKHASLEILKIHDESV